jgi:dihydrolipoamide dehydrogenase
MQVRTVDVAVVGAGTAGLNARREAERQGASTVLIESGPYGTMCARGGCMPSKLRIAAAEAAHAVDRADEFGIRVPAGVRVDASAVLGRVRRERDRFLAFVVADTEALPEAVRIRGHARFVAPGVLQVDDHTRVEAKAIVLAVGSSPVVPPQLEKVRDRVLVNDDIFELKDLPQSIAVIGSGIIALELGQALHRLGVRTTLFARSRRVGPLTDPEVMAAARELFSRELDIRLNVRVEADDGSGGGVRIRWNDDAGRRGEEDFERVLSATGRRPNLAALDLPRAGIELADGGMPSVDPRTGRIGDSSVFSAGDATGDRALLHEAADEGRIAGFNAANLDEIRAHHRRVPISIVFSDPQIGLAGRPHRSLDLERIEIGSVDYGDQGRARVMGQSGGLVRVYADRDDGRLLGAEMLGPRVEHTAHLLAWVIQEGRTVDRVLELPFYHPVIEEGVRTALRDLGRRLKLTRAPCARELDCGPGA